MLDSIANALRIWRAYGASSLSTRLRVIGRSFVCPYHAFLHHFPRSGSILDVGCGDGLLELLLSWQPQSSQRTYVGIDHAEDKIDGACLAAIAGARFEVRDLSAVAPEQFDCVALVDVLYCVPVGEWPAFLAQCSRVLKPGGTLILKEVVDRPRWKYWFSYLEEILAIKVLKMTQGQSPHFESEAVYRSAIDGSGSYVAEVVRLDAGRPYPHCLFVARKPASDPGQTASANESVA